MTHYGYTPNSHNWRIYAVDDSTAKANQNVKPTGIGETEAFVLHLCVHETGGDSGANAKSLDVEYSDDQATWYTLGAQAGVDKKFRWDDNPNLTHLGAINIKLSCETEDCLNHESASADGFTQTAGTHGEVALAIEGYNPGSLTTYYFRIKINGSYPVLEDPPNSYAQIQIEEIVGPQEADECITKINENINGNINNGIN